MYKIYYFIITTKFDTGELTKIVSVEQILPTHVHECFGLEPSGNLTLWPS